MAYKKVCPECGKPSYSANNHDNWTCPYCQNDLTKVKVNINKNKKNIKNN